MDSITISKLPFDFKRARQGGHWQRNTSAEVRESLKILKMRQLSPYYSWIMHKRKMFVKENTEYEIVCCKNKISLPFQVYIIYEDTNPIKLQAVLHSAGTREHTSIRMSGGKYVEMKSARFVLRRIRWRSDPSATAFHREYRTLPSAASLAGSLQLFHITNIKYCQNSRFSNYGHVICDTVQSSRYAPSGCSNLLLLFSTLKKNTTHPIQFG